MQPSHGSKRAADDRHLTAGFHHRDGHAALPSNVRIVRLPPYSPELNPVEKLWDIVSAALNEGGLHQRQDIADADVKTRKALETAGNSLSQWLTPATVVANRRK